MRERLAKAPAKEKEGIEQQIENIARRRTEMLPLLITLRDKAKAGRKVMLPLVNREIPLICDEWAKPELGTYGFWAIVLFSVLFFLTFVYEVARGGLDWGPLRRRTPVSTRDEMVSAERTLQTTIRRVGTEGRGDTEEAA